MKRKPGRPKKEPTSTITIRHEKKVIDKVKKKHSDLQDKGREWLNKLAEI